MKGKTDMQYLIPAFLFIIACLELFKYLKRDHALLYPKVWKGSYVGTEGILYVHIPFEASVIIFRRVDA